MELETTVALLVAALCLAAAGVAGDWARRRAPLAWHALLPWNAAVFVGLTLALLSVAHLLSLN